MITVEIEGTEGTHVTGNLGDQISKEEFTSLPTPDTLELPDPIGSVILSVRKVESEGSITVKVIRDGIVVESEQTSAPFGMINMTIQPED